MMSMNGLRILVVEDEFLVALALEDILLQLGCKVVGPVPRLSEALEIAGSADLDGALLDVNVRGETVFPVIDVLQSRAVPVILCSGYSLTNTLPAPYDTLPQVTKPYNPDALRNVMEAVLVSPAASDPGASPPPAS